MFVSHLVARVNIIARMIVLKLKTVHFVLCIADGKSQTQILHNLLMIFTMDIPVI